MTARLFFAIASPYPMVQLQEIFGVMRGNHKVLPLVKPRTPGKALRMESSQLVSLFGSKFCLVTTLWLYTKRRNELGNCSPRVFTGSELPKTIIV